jgi:hypothetical protein
LGRRDWTTGELEQKELLVLKVCLQEINRSRPFLIALIGDRYGWVPPPERMTAATQEAGYQTEVQGKSVTALEIEYGVLDSADQRRRSRFYFRDPLPYDQMPPEVAARFSDAHSGTPGAADAANRLAKLKERIQGEMPDRCRSYQAQWDAGAPPEKAVVGLKAWGDQLLEDLWSDLEQETRAFALQPIPTWQEQERWVLEQFVENRGRGFIGRTEITRELLQTALSPRQDGAEAVKKLGQAPSQRSIWSAVARHHPCQASTQYFSADAVRA